CRQHDLSKLVQPLLLLLVQELRVTDDVDEQDMPDFQAGIVVGVSWHSTSLTGGSSGDHDYFVSSGALLTLACKENSCLGFPESKAHPCCISPCRDLARLWKHFCRISAS